ncbi:hypothetical protein MHA01_18870 [Marinococcus halophilus]|uniref:Uncharacterized protein n=1 Tax=Marinococcus halophilus TaxID=1371 RepID=A0A510Y6J4_MARHA|nr:hypothetical protein MHA01_18870 [Marinococcus halophilus]
MQLDTAVDPLLPVEIINTGSVIEHPPFYHDTFTFSSTHFYRDYDVRSCFQIISVQEEKYEQEKAPLTKSTAWAASGGFGFRQV